MTSIVDAAHKQDWAAVQAMRAIEHEDLVGGDAMALDELRNLADVRRIHRRKVVAVVDVEASLR